MQAGLAEKKLTAPAWQSLEAFVMHKSSFWETEAQIQRQYPALNQDEQFRHLHDQEEMLRLRPSPSKKMLFIC